VRRGIKHGALRVYPDGSLDLAQVGTWRGHSPRRAAEAMVDDGLERGTLVAFPDGSLSPELIGAPWRATTDDDFVGDVMRGAIAANNQAWLAFASTVGPTLAKEFGISDERRFLQALNNQITNYCIKNLVEYYRRWMSPSEKGILI